VKKAQIESVATMAFVGTVLTVQNCLTRKTTVEAIKALKTRRSKRKFLPTPVPKEMLKDIIDCGRLAPSAVNIQPVEFIVVTKAKIRKRIAEMADYGKFIAEAPVCVAVFSRQTKYYLEDGSAASENILLAAHAHGLGACWVAGDKKPYAEKVRQLLGASQDFKLISLIPMGYSEQQPKPAKRKLKDVLHWEKY
jgi:nitroreductase